VDDVVIVDGRERPALVAAAGRGTGRGGDADHGRREGLRKMRRLNAKLATQRKETARISSLRPLRAAAFKT
jgi:hypothetical protein